MTLRAPEILLCHLCLVFGGQWTVRHGVLVHAVVLEVGHHVGEAGLSCGLSSLLLNFVHLF